MPDALLKDVPCSTKLTISVGDDVLSIGCLTMSNCEQRQTVLAALQETILSIAFRQGVVSADDVRREVAIPYDMDPRIVGPAFLMLKKQGWIEEIGDHRTWRTVAHRRSVRDWRLKSDRYATVASLYEIT